MTYYQKGNFKLWLDRNRNSNSQKYLGYVTSFRKRFLTIHSVPFGTGNSTLDDFLENLSVAIAYDKKKTVYLLRLYVKLAEKTVNSPSCAIINEYRSLKQHLGVFKWYVDFIEEECSEPKNGRSNWSYMFKPYQQTVLQLLDYKIVLTHDELVEKFIQALATQDRFSYSRPDHILFPAQEYTILSLRVRGSKTLSWCQVS